jgi:predicted  nucleic acid-binding Zn-ribbon protein
LLFKAHEFACACNHLIDCESIIAAATSVKAGIDEGHALLQVDRLHVARDASERTLRDRERAHDDCVIAIDNFEHESTKFDEASAARQRAEAARQRAEVVVTFALEEWKLVTTNATNDVTAADNRDLNAADDKLTAANRDLNAANRDLSAAQDSRLIAKSELTSANRKLADADRELAKANHNLSMAVAAADNSLEAAAGQHLRCLNSAMTTLSSAVDRARKDVGNENPESLMGTLVCELKATASAYATKQNIIESLHLKSTSTNQYVLIALRCAARVGELVRDCTVAKRAHRVLVEALRASGGDSEAFATQNMLVAVCDKYLTAECAERPEGTQFVRGRDFVAGALAALTDRITADARLNEATIWVHNNPLFTNAFLRCGATLEESWVTLEAESADTGTVHPRTAQIIDVVVALGGQESHGDDGAKFSRNRSKVLQPRAGHSCHEHARGQ